MTVQDTDNQILSAHTVSWRRLTDRCENHNPRCERPGEGWVVDPTSPPVLMAIAYRCAEHGLKVAENRRRLNGSAEFVHGRTDDFARSLNVLWKIEDGPESGTQKEEKR